MGNVHCRICGASAHSKCPSCRTVFQSNQFEAMLSWGFKRKITTDKHGVNWLEMSWFMGDGTKKDDVEWGLQEFYETLQKMADPDNEYPSFAEYACDHEWVLRPGHNTTIDCVHKRKR